MKMILTLTRNEYKKLFGKKSTAVLLLLLILTVFGISMIKPYSYYSEHYYYDRYYYDLDMRIQDTKNRIVPDSIINSTQDPYDKAHMIVYNEIFREQIEILELAKELNITDYNDWRYNRIHGIADSIENIYIYKYIKEGGEHSEYLERYLSYPAEYYEEIINNLDNSLEVIRQNDYAESNRPDYEDVKRRLEEDRAALTEAVEKKNNGEGQEDIDHIIFRLEGMVFASENIVKAYEYLLNNGYEYRSSEAETVFIAIGTYSTLRSDYNSFLSEAQYNSPNQSPGGEKPYYPEFSANPDKTYVYYEYEYGYSQSIPYEEYYEAHLERISLNKNQGAIAMYALENEVTELSVANSARYKALSFVHLFWFIAPLAIFIAGGMVSKEFSARTINLLLIRPVKRWKILLSKYLCLFTFVLGAVLLSIGFYLLGTGIRLGFADLAQPYIFATDGIAHGANFILWLLGKVLLATLPVICLISITFMLSTVTKGTAVALILGILTLLSSILIFFIRAFDSASKMTYIPFPYFSMWSYLNDDILLLQRSMESPFSYFMEPNLLYGSLFLLGMTVLSVIIAFVHFKKTDVK